MEVVTLDSDEEKEEKKDKWAKLFGKKKEVQTKAKKEVVPQPEVEITDSQESMGSSSFMENELAIGTGKALVKSSEIIERRDKVFLEVFKHKKYKTKLQMRAINCILKRQCDVYVSLPTGAGKSLCYQLPAVVHGGVSVVISPLIALMKDQICSLRAKGIPCETLNSTLNAAEKSKIMADLGATMPKIRMLYITAEGAATDSMKRLLGDLNRRELLRYIIVDEAHCVTHWGHDFRPDYLSLGKLRDVCSGVPWVALTATANAKAQDDIVFQLKMKNVESFKAGTYRDNLYYDVCMRDHLSCAPENHLATFITKCLTNMESPKKPTDNGIKDKNVRTENKKTLAGSAIVYCRSRNECEQMALTLNKAGITALAYHAGLGKKDRNEVQDKWMSNEVAVVTATVAFGMGIDKPDVRLVVHWSPSQNLAGYYQEAGRAGRDGKRSYCRIYYSNSDKNALNFLVSGDLAKLREKAKKKNTEGEKAELQIKAIQNGLAKMIEYCESAQCRHVSIAKFFDDTDCRPCKSNCDFCRNPKDTEKKLQDFAWGSTKKLNAYNNRWKSNGTNVDGDDLYGGGRSTLAKDEEMWNESASSSNVKERCEIEESQRLRGVLRDEFAKRRKSTASTDREPKRAKVERKPAEDVAVISFELNLIKNVTLEQRESWTRHFLKALQDNWITGSSNPDVSAKLCAEKLEFAIYGNCKSEMIYRNKCTHKIGEIKKLTREAKKFEFENSTIEKSGFSKASNLI